MSRALLYDCSLNCITVDMMLPFNTVTVVNSFHLKIICIGLYQFATGQTACSDVPDCDAMSVYV